MTSGVWPEHWDRAFATDLHEGLVRYLPGQRWFAAKARTLTRMTLDDWVSLPLGDGRDATLLFVLVEFAHGPAERYLLPLLVGPATEVSEAGPLVASRMNPSAAAVDLIRDPAVWEALLNLLLSEGGIPTQKGAILAKLTSAGQQLDRVRVTGPLTVQSRQQSHSSALVGDVALIKLFRRLAHGRNPEVEIGEALADQIDAPLPRLFGWLEYQTPDSEATSLAILQQLVPNDGDAWAYTLNALGEFCQRISSESPSLRDADSAPVVATAPELLRQADRPMAPVLRQYGGAFGQHVELLGQRTAEMHQALASRRDLPAFCPESLAPDAQRQWHESMTVTIQESFQRLAERIPFLPPQVQRLARQATPLQSCILERLDQLLAVPIRSLQIRLHGDYHLGQVLWTGTDFVIIDFEGEPDRSLAERRAQRTPLRDVAGMLRSFHYASNAGLMGLIPHLTMEDSQETTGPSPHLKGWYVEAAETFLQGYLQVAQGKDWFPSDPGEVERLLEACLLEKLMYELSYELNSRPDWSVIPLAGLLELADALAAPQENPGRGTSA